MKGKDLFKDSEAYASMYDLIEEEATKKLEYFKDMDENAELEEEEADRLSLIMDYKFRAQEQLENSYLVMQRLRSV